MSRAAEEMMKFFEARRAEFGLELPRRLAALETLCDRAFECPAANMEEFERGAHSLAGSAGVFGYADVGRAAAALEAAVRQLRASGVVSNRCRSVEVAAVLERLKQSAPRAEL